MASYVYVISGDHGRQKIGISDSPRRRISELQTGSPFPLKFEFVGEVAESGAGPVEVEAHFMLNQHKAPGGDEWFVVPPDVAVTAVMAAAHRLGYRVKPVDPDALAAPSIKVGTQPWHHLMALVASVPTFGILYWLLSRFDSGDIGGVAFAICIVGLIGCFSILRMALIQLGDTFQWIKGPSV